MIDLKPLDQLDPAAVAANQAEVVDRLQAAFPHLDVRRGVLAEVVAYIHAVLAAQYDENVAAYWAARSLDALLADPAGADPDLVDDVLSNFRVARRPGAASAGRVTVVVSDDVTVTVAQGALFAAAGRQFATETVFTAKVDAGQVVTAGDRLLTPTAGGDWAFTIDVVAVDEGPAGDVAKDTLVVPAVLPPGYVTSYAAADFGGGLDAETNEELLNRLQEGLAAKGLPGRVAMAATLHAEPAFAAVPRLSVAGMGDPEMGRDKHSVFPVAMGGRVDWYVRTQARVARQALTKTATLVEKLAYNRGVWQLAVGRDDAPGFYELADVRPAGAVAAGGFPTVAFTRTADLSGPAFVPDMAADSVEWVFSRYQAGVLRFTDTETPVADLAVGATKDYELSAVGLPLVGDIQDWAAGPDVRPRPYDLLVKAAVPCFVQLSFTVTKKAGEADPDREAIATALCEEVNGVGFVGRLHASQLYDVVHNHLVNSQVVSRLDMLGRLLRPDGATTWLRDDVALVVPDDPAGLVTHRTVQFYLSPEDVAVTIATETPDA
jgi:hypothetical protein